MLSRLLVNPYTLGALALAFVGMGGAIGWYAWDAAAWETKAVAARAEARRLEGERDTVIALSAQKDKEIARLTRQAEINNNIMADLHQDIRQLNIKADETNKALDSLEQSNVDVKAFMAGTLPIDYQRLLEQRAKAYGGSSTKGDSVGP